MKSCIAWLGGVVNFDTSQMVRNDSGTPMMPPEMLLMPQRRPTTRLRSTTVSVGMPMMPPNQASAPSLTFAAFATIAAASARNSAETKLGLIVPTWRAAATMASFDPKSCTKSRPNHSDQIR